MKSKMILITVILLYSNITFSQGNKGILPINDGTGKVEWAGKILKIGQKKLELYSKIMAWGIAHSQEIILNDNTNGIMKIKLMMPFRFNGNDFNMIYSMTLLSNDDSIKYTMTDCVLLKRNLGIKMRKPFESIDPKDKDYIKPFHEIADKMNKLITELESL